MKLAYRILFAFMLVGGASLDWSQDAWGRGQVQEEWGFEVEAGGHDLPFDFAQVDGAGANAYEAQFERDSVGLEIARSLPGGVRARWERDNLGRPVRQSLEVRGQEVRARVYKWEVNDRLKQILDSLSGPIMFEHDALGSLVSATFQDSAERTLRDLRTPDAVGNLFRTREKKDRKYGPSGELLEARGADGVTSFEYDIDGNLVKKVGPQGSWKYEWNGAGRLVRVVRPDGTAVTFGYDALGRRVWKQWKSKRTRWVWDGNVPLHEWVEKVVEAEAVAVKSAGADATAAQRHAALLNDQPAQGPPSGAKPHQLAAAQEGTSERPVTWLFEPESFTPLAKLVGDEKFSVVADHLGVPTSMVDVLGRVVWQAEIGIWGDLRDVQGVKSACPFRWPGQYEDEETGLYYNRFRYYAPEAGQYVSRDPIGLLGGMGLNNYVADPTATFDPYGLASCRPTSKRAFWSGGPIAQKAAEAWSKNNGYTTLEQTKTGKNLSASTKNLDWTTQSRPRWSKASERYAKGAKGDVHVFQRESGVRIAAANDPGTVWQETEYPALQANPKVKSIVYHVVRDDGSSYIVP